MNNKIAHGVRMMASDIPRIREALHFIPAHDRDTWLRVGMAVKSELGEPGFDLWEEWSQQDESFDPKAARAVWKSFRSAGRITVGTLFHHAKTRGWRDDGTRQKPTSEDIASRRREATQREAKNEEKIARENAEAAEKAAMIWKAATPVMPDQPYLLRKGISPVETLREIEAQAATAILRYAPKSDGNQLVGRLLVVPVKIGDDISTCELIDGDGRKSAIAGGRKAGGYWAGQALPDNDGDGLTFQYGEGVATTLSAQEANGYLSIATLSAGNLSAVTKTMHQLYPAAMHVVLADLLKKTGAPDPHAEEAARSVGGRLAVPDFGADRPDGAKDFNDLHRLFGLETVRRCIEGARTSVAASTADVWPIPTPLPDALPPVQPFDSELLPAALRAWIMDIANRMQCPPDFPAVGALVGLSSLIGARVVVQPKARDDWQVVPNLWGLIVGRPGVMKSPALREVLKPLDKMEKTTLKLWKAAHNAWEIDAKLTSLQSADNEKRAKVLANKDPAAARALLQQMQAPDESAARRFIVNDTSMEKLGEVLQINPWGTLAYRDELYGLLTGMDKQGQEGSRAFYLQAYDGNQGYTFDRIGRGTVRIDRVCLAMVGGIQPGRVLQYVRAAVAGGGADDGLLQRFGLTVWPDATGEFHHVDEWPDTSARQTAWAVFDRFASLQPDSDTEPRIWRFDEAAQALFVKWRIPFEQELKTGELQPAMESHLAKYRKLIPALALLFALIDTPESSGLIGEKELIRALAWGDYLRSHANRLYSVAAMPETSGAALLLKKLRIGALGVEFTARIAAQKGWTGLDTPDAVRKAADVLIVFDWLRREVQPSSDAMGRGRPSELYQVNPAALLQVV